LIINRKAFGNYIALKIIRINKTSPNHPDSLYANIFTVRFLIHNGISQNRSFSHCSENKVLEIKKSNSSAFVP
jgi:recombinational DNA repair protein (RecF pathway)